MKNWEYKILVSEIQGWRNKKLDPTLEKTINELGNVGWELVSFTMSGDSSSAWESSTTKCILVFKRPKT